MQVFGPSGKPEIAALEAGTCDPPVSVLIIQRCRLPSTRKMEASLFLAAGGRMLTQRRLKRSALSPFGLPQVQQELGSFDVQTRRGRSC